MENKREVLGQYFTKLETVNKLVELLLSYKIFSKNINILEPSFGTGNFITVLKQKGFTSIDGCEIDSFLTNTPEDFFDFPLNKIYDLIIGNTPFTKYNLPESYFKPKEYSKKLIKPWQYLPAKESKSEKLKIENSFIYKSLYHLKNNKDSSIGFVLPISFFIKNRNRDLKNALIKKFKTIIIYQNNDIWFDYNIPCCFTIFSDIDSLKNKIKLIYEDKIIHSFEFDFKDIHEELIPEVIKNKANCNITNGDGTPLNFYLDERRVLINKSYVDNNISAKNILEKNIIPDNKNIDDYKLAIVRVGNSSVGKAGLINIKEDILNDMFFIFDLKDEYKSNKLIKEKICNYINFNSDYFKNITSRVGSKSIKKEDVYNFKVTL